MLVVALVVIEAVYLFSSGLMLYLRGLQHVNADHNPDYPVYLAGELGHRFLSYFAAAWLLKEPLATIVLALTGLAFLILPAPSPRLPNRSCWCLPWPCFWARRSWPMTSASATSCPCCPSATC